MKDSDKPPQHFGAIAMSVSLVALVMNYVVTSNVGAVLLMAGVVASLVLGIMGIRRKDDLVMAWIGTVVGGFLAFLFLVGFIAGVASSNPYAY